MINLAGADFSKVLEDSKKEALREELISDINNNISRLYNKVTAEQVADAALNDLWNSVIGAEQKKAIIEDIASGKVKDMQLKLGMDPKASDLEKKADNLFGKRTLKNLKELKLLENVKTLDNGEVQSLNKVEVTPEKVYDLENLTVDAYKEILTKAKKDAEFKKSLSDMLKNIDKGTGKIVITKKNEKADRLDVSDTITFDFSSNSIEQTISLWPAFENINTILDNHVVAKKPQEFIYTYQTGTWKIETGVKSDTETNNETKDSHEGISIDGYEAIAPYLDEETKLGKNRDDIVTFLKGKVEEIEPGRKYRYGDILISKIFDKNSKHIGWGYSIVDDPTYFVANKRVYGLKTTKLLNKNPATLKDTLSFAAYLNYVAWRFKNEQTGTDKEEEVDLDDFGTQFWGDNNPFYVSSSKLYFSDAGTTDDYDLIKQTDLDKVATGVKIEDLAKFFTNYVNYIWDENPNNRKED